MKLLLPILLLLLASIPAVQSLFYPGYFPMHDDTQVARVIEMGRALTEGQFPVRMVRDLGYGYGYPMFNFYGPLPYYFGGLLYAFGVSALIATKVMFGVGTILPAVTLYWALVGFGWQTALVSSLLYLYAPYHAAQIYVRGSVGEYWILIFWPLILGAIVRKNFVLAGIATAGAILSHTLMGYVTVIALLLGFAFKPLVLGLGLSAFFWLPAVAEMGYTSVSGQVSTSAHFADHFVCPGQLWSSLWGFGGSAPGCIDGMSFMLGKVHILIAIGSTVLYFVIKNRHKTFFIGLVLTAVGVFFATSYSRMFWQIIPYFSYLQYPWRFLSIASLGLALVGGSFVHRTVPALILSALVVGMNAKWFQPQHTYPSASKEFETQTDIRWRVSKISDEYLPFALPRPKEESETVFDTIAGRKLEETATSARYVVESTELAEIVVRKAYFPGWRYWINNQEVIPKIEAGLPVLALGPGQSVIELTFNDTPIRTFGNVLSLVSLLILGWKLYDNQRKAKR